MHMRIFVAGGTGAIGARLVPLLVAAGHRVSATTRTSGKAERLRAAGATPVVVDALDQAAIRDAVAHARPEAVVHQLTAIPARLDMRRFDRDFAPTNRLRREGTDHLLGAAREAGARRFVAQSFAGWPYAREGGPVKSEDDPLDPRPPPALRATLAAIRHLEAAAATLAAIERGAPGSYNIVDDEPAPASAWLPGLAATIGARPPLHVPAWLARLLAGAHVVALMTTSRGASNAKAKQALGWRPAHATWRTGFPIALHDGQERQTIPFASLQQ